MEVIKMSLVHYLHQTELLNRLLNRIYLLVFIIIILLIVVIVLAVSLISAHNEINSLNTMMQTLTT